MSSDPDDLQTLTPAHFLVGRCDPPLPLELSADATVRVDLRKRWIYVQMLVKAVWQRWLKEFVPLLNVRRKWLKTKQNVAVGDIVLYLAPDTPRRNWPLGKVMEVFPGADGCVRVVDLLVQGKVYRRSVHHLLPLVSANGGRLFG